MIKNNMGSLQPYTSFCDIKNITLANVDLFVEPSIKELMRQIAKLLKKAIENGELKEFNFIQFRLETTLFKEFSNPFVDVVERKEELKG